MSKELTDLAEWDTDEFEGLTIVQVYRSRRRDFVVFLNRRPYARYFDKKVALHYARRLVKDAAARGDKVFLDDFTGWLNDV